MKKIVLSKHVLLTALVSGVLLCACANTDIYSGDVYKGSEAKAVRQVSYGEITSVRVVKIQGDAPGVVGTLGGGVIGGALGHGVGKGQGRNIATAVGAVAGAVIGSSLEQKVNLVNAFELGIKKDTGEHIVVVQRANSGFTVGQRVRLTDNGQSVNVAPLY